MKCSRPGRFSWIQVLCMLGLALCVLSACTSGSPKTGTQSPKTSATPAQKPAACVALDPANKAPAPASTTLSTLEQAYWCLLDHYVTGKTLDNQVLLEGAFGALVQELLRKGLDQATAMLPALSGDRQADWQVFSTAYQKVSQALAADADLQQDLAAATMQGMVQSLHDNHTSWSVSPPAAVLEKFPNGVAYGLGIVTSASAGPTYLPEARSPLFVTEVQPGSPAAAQHIALGDIIIAVNGNVPFSNDQLNPGVMAWLFPQPATDNQAVRVTFSRPRTGQTWTVTLTPTFFAPPVASPVSARALSDSLAYVRLTNFVPDAGDLVRQALEGLHLKNLHGIVLDLRGNSGGSPTGVSQLLGAFVHDTIWGYLIDGNGQRFSQSVDNSVPLLHLSLVVLTDRHCASACDAFAGAVRDQAIGPLVGTRTAGAIAGAASAYFLNDGSVLGITAQLGMGVKGEMLNGIGVAPDYEASLTAQELSSGQDPAIAKAITLLS
jgi:carboxyl-terminal processing protease